MSADGRPGATAKGAVLGEGEAYESLPHMIDEMPAPGERVFTWGGQLWRDDEGPFEVPAHYFPCIHRMWNTFWLCGWSPDDPYHYFDVHSGRFDGEVPTPAAIGRYTVRECKHLLTDLYRLEASCLGAWEEAHEAGLFHAIARQMIWLASGGGRGGAQASRP